MVVVVVIEEGNLKVIQEVLRVSKVKKGFYFHTTICQVFVQTLNLGRLNKQDFHID